MGRRSPLNKRYQKDAKVGSTRKSAAAAKPKRSDASASGTSSSRSSASKGKNSSRYQRIEIPPDIKRLQTISFGLLGVAVVISVAYLWKGQSLGVSGSVLLGVAYACMFLALYLDFAKVRPVLKAIRKGETPPGKPTRSASTKPAAEAKPKAATRADDRPEKDADSTSTDKQEDEGI